MCDNRAAYWLVEGTSGRTRALAVSILIWAILCLVSGSGRRAAVLGEGLAPRGIWRVSFGLLKGALPAKGLIWWTI